MAGDKDALEDLSQPEELRHIPTSSYVLEAESVVGELGRTYHSYNQGKYYLPNDAAEQNRLDFQHAGIMKLLGGKYVLAPMAMKPKLILDVACGTGIWAIEYAELNPDVKVIGTDLSAIQPANAPKNCEFVKADAEAEWGFPHKFDYIHMRGIFTCFDSPSKVFSSAFDSMKPGGWLELQDSDLNMQRMNGSMDGTALQEWSRSVIQGAASMGRNIQVTPHFADWVRDAGFIDVEEKKMLWPCGPWSEDSALRLVGNYHQQNWCEGIVPTSWKLLRASGLSPVEATSLSDQVKAEIKNPTYEFYHFIYIVTGRKPEASDVQTLETTAKDA